MRGSTPIRNCSPLLPFSSKKSAPPVFLSHAQTVIGERSSPYPGTPISKWTKWKGDTSKKWEGEETQKPSKNRDDEVPFKNNRP